MMGLVHSAVKREQDALDIEFDAVYKEARVKSGKPCGPFLVTAETVATQKQVPVKKQKPTPSLYHRMGDAVYDAVEWILGRRTSRA